MEKGELRMADRGLVQESAGGDDFSRRHERVRVTRLKSCAPDMAPNEISRMS